MNGLILTATSSALWSSPSIPDHELGDRKTIADSKRDFHQLFPYVIAPLYRRLADELLVELHLLSHQKQFKSNSLFAVGLDTVFRAFTQGYRPEDHPPLLFKALCDSNGFEADQLRKEAATTLEKAGNQSDGAFDGWVKQFQRPEDAHYSRLMAIGLFSLLDAANGEADAKAKVDQLKTQTSELSETLGLNRSRVDKDISLFLASRERMEQAVELMEETLASERKKREQRLAESAQGTAS
jgi:photosystem II biogenesis protein Psp29